MRPACSFLRKHRMNLPGAMASLARNRVLASVWDAVVARKPRSPTGAKLPINISNSTLRSCAARFEHRRLDGIPAETAIALVVVRFAVGQPF